MANATSILPLSNSVQGLGIKVSATATPGTLIHTTSISATMVDQMYLSVTNSDSVERSITFEFGGTTAPDNTITIPVPARSGLTYVVPGLILLGNGATGLTVRAFCATTNVLVVYGQVLRVTP